MSRYLLSVVRLWAQRQYDQHDVVYEVVCASGNVKSYLRVTVNVSMCQAAKCQVANKKMI